MLETCTICNRKFNASSLAKHRKICTKVFQRKRKPFGPDGERMQRKQELAEKAQENSNKDRAKPAWQHQHEVFQHSVKSAKGDESDLPPPEDTRTPCPHCGRKFERTVAEKHIPSCAKKHLDKKNNPPPTPSKSRNVQPSPAARRPSNMPPDSPKRRTSAAERAPSPLARPPTNAAPSSPAKPVGRTASPRVAASVPAVRAGASVPAVRAGAPGKSPARPKGKR